MYFFLDGLSFGLELLRERNESNIVVLSGFCGENGVETR